MIHNLQISVILTTYNEKDDFLLQCLNSILNQTFKNFELIIVFEPNDSNYQLVKNLALIDHRIIIICNKTKLGFVKSLNVALLQSKGKYIARIDSDDFCELARFEQQISYFDKHPDVDVLGSDLNIVDKYNKLIAVRHYKSNHEKIKNSFLFTIGVAHPSVMIKKKCFDDYGYYNEDFIFAEDTELWLRFIKHGCIFHNLNKKLLNYRITDINEIRVKSHWEFNFRARRMYVFSIWNTFTAYVSVLVAFVLAKAPLFLMSFITGNKFSNFLKGKKKLNETN